MKLNLSQIIDRVLIIFLTSVGGGGMVGAIGLYSEGFLNISEAILMFIGSLICNGIGLYGLRKISLEKQKVNN